MKKMDAASLKVAKILFAGFTFVLGAITLQPVSAQTFTTLHGFTGGTDGANPYAALILSSNTLFGTAVYGGNIPGDQGNGTVFAIKTDGTGFRILHTFGGLDGFSPYGGLILSSNVLFGTTHGGGTSADGTVFRVNTDGTGFKTLHNFNGGDGGNLSGTLILSGTVLYGTTGGGGKGGAGSVFKVNKDGSGFTTLHSFTSDGNDPYAGLILSGSTLYGTTAF